MAQELSARIFDFARTVATFQRDAILAHSLDRTESSMHNVHEAILDFDRAIASATSHAKLAQLEERCAAFAEMWEKLQEQARDKAETLKGEGQ